MRPGAQVWCAQSVVLNKKPPERANEEVWLALILDFTATCAHWFSDTPRILPISIV